MTSPEDDLRDLIAELDRLHSPEDRQEVVPIWVENENGMPEQRSDLKDITTCSDCVDSWGNSIPWPCDTGKIVDKYKRRAHRRKYIIHAAVDPAYPTDKSQLMQLAVTEKPHGRIIHYFETLTQADAWIEQQYEENK